MARSSLNIRQISTNEDSIHIYSSQGIHFLRVFKNAVRNKGSNGLFLHLFIHQRICRCNRHIPSTCSMCPNLIKFHQILSAPQQLNHREMAKTENPCIIRALTDRYNDMGNGSACPHLSIPHAFAWLGQSSKGQNECHLPPCSHVCNVLYMAPIPASDASVLTLA